MTTSYNPRIPPPTWAIAVILMVLAALLLVRATG